MLLAGTYEGMLAGWSLSAEKESIGVSFAFVPHSAPVRGLAAGPIASAGPTLITTSSDESARVFDLTARRSVGQLVAHHGETLPAALRGAILHRRWLMAQEHCL